MDKNSTELGKIAPSDITRHRKYVSRRAQFVQGHFHLQ
jgi:hypothetical protein